MYLKSYGGLSRPAWMLAFVILINRSGAMVLPFLSLYLKDELQFQADDVALILMLFGVGSLTGSYLGGILSDKYGTFIVQFWSLVFTGIGFFALSYLNTVVELATGFFAITVISDTFRPANAAAVAKHAKPENLTRAYSLNRMAINLGFAVGPAVGGILASTSYKLLFYVNGITCLLAALVFAMYFYKIRLRNPANVWKANKSKLKSPFRDKRFIVFTLLTVGFGTVFFQFLFTLPVYYREYYFLSEKMIGGLLALNGFLVFALEMPLVYIFNKKASVRKTVFIGCVLLIFTFSALNFAHGIYILIISMTLLSLSEILAMPFLTTYSAHRGGEHSRGAYLGMYSMGYSLSFIVAPALGLYIIQHRGYPTLWWVVSGISVLVTLGFFYVIGPVKTKPETMDILSEEI